MSEFRHADLLKRLLPPESIDTNAARISAELEAEGAVLDQALQSAFALALEMEPESTSALLPDWERNYGLPDECLEGEAQSKDQRRAALLAKITGIGGQSRPYFISLAAALGYADAEVTEFRPATCNDHCNSPVCGEEWRIVWRLDLLQDSALFIANCNSACDDPLQAWGNRQLECMIRRYKPADTTLLFAYGVS
jgi:uncharacterized protein YmfQ (DUF2313 family)